MAGANQGEAEQPTQGIQAESLAIVIAPTM